MALKKEVKAFKDAWEESNSTKDRKAAKEIAHEYVEANHSELFAAIGRMSIPQLVKVIDTLRENGQEEERLIVEMWLLDKFEPQNITASVNKQFTPDETADAIAALGKRG